MTVELQGLLERITEDGLEKADKEKQEILDAARAEAKRLTDEAAQTAEKMVAEAKTEAEKLKLSGEAALRQAARDVLISLETRIRETLEQVVEADTGKAMTADMLAGMIESLAKAYARSGQEAVSVEALASPAQLEELEAAFKARLAEHFRAGITLQPVAAISAGIQVSFNGESVAYDISSEAIREMLCAYLNPRITEILSNDSEK